MSVPDQRGLKERYAEYITGWREHEAAEQQRIIARAYSARAAVDACVSVLIRKYRVQRVWLFGSLLDPEQAHKQTDIDLAVQGLDAAAYFSALAEVYHCLPFGVDLDLVTMETAQPSLREHILQTGELLYERK